MKKEPTWLLDYQRNVYSQTGEDGVIEKILELIPQANKWCVEFGAWDGIHLTNTRNLIESRGYSAVLIEANKSRFLNLKKNYAHYNNVITLNNLVGFTSEASLDQILKPLPIPADFDLLSIDIDGNDYHVWKAVSDYKPKVVVIEFNPTIPTAIRFVQPADQSVQQGASLLSLVELGREKGYELVCVLPINAFFVKKEYYPDFQIITNAPEVLRTNLEHITYFFSGYDGKIFLQGNRRLPWHNLDIKQESFQYLPKFLRKHPGNYTILEKVAFVFYLLVKEPGRFIREISKKIKTL